MSRFSVKKPLTVFVVAVIIIALGIVSVTGMTPDLLPSIDLPYVVVMTTYSGATPEEVERGYQASGTESGYGGKSQVRTVYIEFQLFTGGSGV